MALRIENHSQAVHFDLRKLSGWNAQDRRSGMVKDLE